MLPDQVSLTLSILFILFVVCFSLRLRLQRKYALLAKIPGPPALPLVGNILEFRANNFDVVKTITKVAKNYGGLALMWVGHSPVVIITAPEHLQLFYGSTKMIDRSDQYQPFNEMIPNSLFTVGGAQWRRQRKIFMLSFVDTPNDLLMSTFTRRSQMLINELRLKADGPVFPCLYPLFQATYYNIVVNAIGIEPDNEEAFIDAVEQSLRPVFMRNFSLLLYFKLTFMLSREGRASMKGAQYIKQTIGEWIKKKKQDLQEIKSKGEKIPYLYIYNLFEHLKNESYELLHSEIMFLILAGLDTTAGTMAFTLITLGLHPEVQEKVYQEDQEVQKRLAGRDVTVEILLQNYQYLDRVIKETHRLFGIGPILGRKCSEDVYFGKYLIPKGTNVVAVQCYTNHNADIYSDPFKFDPDRFLPENAAKIPPYAFNPFGGGPRNCPGNRYATIAMRIFLPAIVREFRISTKYNSVEEALSNVDSEITLKDKDHFPIRLQTRKN